MNIPVSEYLEVNMHTCVLHILLGPFQYDLRLIMDDD